MTMVGESFSTIFSRALQGQPCTVVGLDVEPRSLPMSSWTREADVDDHDLLSLCDGSTIDIGCGPGRMTAALGATGRVALGIDVVHEAVGQTRARGGSAIVRDVFDSVPGEGTWRTALLADGNLGIGGDPTSLLRRVRQVVHPQGRIVAEVEPPGAQSRTVWAALECAGERSRRFKWSVVGVDTITGLAASVGLAVTSIQQHGERWSAVLQVL